MRARHRSSPRLIESEHDLAVGIRSLRRKCGVVRIMHDKAGMPPLRRRPGGFEGLARIIVGQQLSVASAAAIWSRTEAAVVPFEAPGLLAASDTTLRAAGLSTGKVRTLRAIAAAVAEQGLDLSALHDCTDEEVHAALTAITGIGPWTADIYIMFCLGRADGFAPGDLALQIALQMAAGLDARPTHKELAAFAERWRPWRGVAARLLWAYYKAVKDARSGVPV
ncbi:MAG: DNA-3-methyladenine glycosylase 2 family protein [Hyphomicrobiaceae bacterium]|nr:DNA-3-methyladenine glycosylase 2 family protein [Hyphomicrobiaceae bacterium]